LEEHRWAKERKRITTLIDFCIQLIQVIHCVKRQGQVKKRTQQCFKKESNIDQIDYNNETLEHYFVDQWEPQFVHKPTFQMVTDDRIHEMHSGAQSAEHKMFAGQRNTCSSSRWHRTGSNGCNRANLKGGEDRFVV
jgi:hypothetical protein